MISRKSDWHPADIIAALRKRGTTLAAISRQAGLSSSTLANALSRPWPKGEKSLLIILMLLLLKFGQAVIFILKQENYLNERFVTKLIIN